MGLGKTLQTLTVILKQQPRLNIHACTLIVVPSRAVGDQWADEIRSKTEYGSVPYFVYQEDNGSLIERKKKKRQPHPYMLDLTKSTLSFIYIYRTSLSNHHHHIRSSPIRIQKVY